MGGLFRCVILPRHGHSDDFPPQLLVLAVAEAITILLSCLRVEFARWFAD
jgi:hypothetical protein